MTRELAIRPASAPLDVPGTQSLSAAERAELEREQADQRPMTARCGHCSWVYEGTLGEGRERFQAHLLEEHPEMKPHRQRPKKNRTFRQQVIAARARERGEGSESEPRGQEAALPTPTISSLGAGPPAVAPSGPAEVEPAEGARNGQDAPAGAREDEVSQPAPTGGRRVGGPRQHDEREEPTMECKIDGCDKTPLATRGRFAYLCAEHKAERLGAAPPPARRTVTTRRSPRANGKPPVSRMDVLRDLIAKQQEIDAAEAALAERQQEFNELADRFAEAAA